MNVPLQKDSIAKWNILSSPLPSIHLFATPIYLASDPASLWLTSRHTGAFLAWQLWSEFLREVHLWIQSTAFSPWPMHSRKRSQEPEWFSTQTEICTGKWEVRKQYKEAVGDFFLGGEEKMVKELTQWKNTLIYHLKIIPKWVGVSISWKFIWSKWL